MLSYDVRIALGKAQRSSACRVGGWGGEGDIARRWRGDYTVRRLSLSMGIIIRTRRTIRHDAVPGGRRALPVVCGVGISTAIGRRRSFDVDIDP